MKPVMEWTSEDLFALPIGEFDWLEIKGRSGLDLTLPKSNEDHIRNLLSKAVSAFANSGGGILIFGLQDPRDGWRIDDGGISLMMRRPNTREWLEDIVPTLVDPPLRKLNVFTFAESLPELDSGDNRGIVVLEIGDSEQAPHQALDHKYYGRVGGKSHPLSHRFVMDIFQRRRDPQIAISLSLKKPGWLRLFPPHLVACATNVGRVYAQYVKIDIYLPPMILSSEELDRLDRIVTPNGNKVWRWELSNVERDRIRHEGYPIEGPSRFDPLLPGLSRTWRIPVVRNLGRIPGEQIIRWQVSADNAAPQPGSARWDEIVRTNPVRSNIAALVD